MSARRIPWVALGCGLAAGLALLLAPWLRAHPGLMPPCLFKAVTGHACMTCGLTRCCLALAQGRLPEAFHWHPVAALVLLAMPLVSAWDLHRAWKGRPYPPLPAGRTPRLAFALFLAGTWILQAARGI